MRSNSKCHARMREIQSYLHILKTTSTFYLYEATTVNTSLMQVLRPKKHKVLNSTQSKMLPSPPDRKVTIYYITYYVACKINFCQKACKLAVIFTPKQIAKKTSRTRTQLGIDSDSSSKGEPFFRKLKVTGKLRPKTSIIYMCTL